MNFVKHTELSNVAQFLKDFHKSTENKFGARVTTKPQLVVEHTEWFLDAITDGLKESDKALIKKLATGILTSYKEAFGTASSAALIPWIPLSLPLLRIFWPIPVAKEITTTVPLQMNEAAIFIFKMITKIGSNELEAPSSEFLTSAEVELGQADAMLAATPDNPVVISLSSNSAVANVIDEMISQGIVPSDVAGKVFVDKGMFEIVGAEATDGTNTYTCTCVIKPDEFGRFSGTLDFGAAGQADVVGTVNWESGDLKVTAYIASGATITEVTKLNFAVKLSLEPKAYTKDVIPRLERRDIRAITIQRTTELPVEFIQDVNAALDIDIQAEVLSMLAYLLATAMDARVLGRMLASALHQSGNIVSVDVRPSVVNAFPWGPKMYYQTFLQPALAQLRAAIYSKILVSGTYCIIGNPEDIAFFEAFDNFRYEPTEEAIGGIGYEKADIQGRYKVYATPVVPKGYVLMALKPDQTAAAVNILGLYQPAFVVPFPTGQAGPKFTAMSRFGVEVFRVGGNGILQLRRS